MADWKNNIVEEGWVDPRELMANPENWRIHPTHQRHVMSDVMEEIGWAQKVVLNRRTGNMIDGHLRVDLAIEKDQSKVPYIMVDVTPEKEKALLALLDPIGTLAVADAENLELVMEGIELNGSAVEGFLKDLADQHPVIEIESGESAPEPDPASFWPRVQFQLPPAIYTQWREMWEKQLVEQGDVDKASRLITLVGQMLGAPASAGELEEMLNDA